MLYVPTSCLSFIRLYENGQKVMIAEGVRVTTNTVHFIIKNHLAVDAEIA